MQLTLRADVVSQLRKRAQCPSASRHKRAPKFRMYRATEVATFPPNQPRKLVGSNHSNGFHEKIRFENIRFSHAHFLD